MKISKKIFLAGLLSFGIFFTSGCDNVSYETKSESTSSFEVNSSGTVTTSSSYKETKSESNGELTFKVNDVNLMKGKTEFNLSITNNSDKDTTLQSMTLSFKATDENNKPIQDGSTDYENVNLKLPAGKEVYETFAIEDPNYAAYDKSFNADYEISNIVLNPPVK